MSLRQLVFSAAFLSVAALVITTSTLGANVLPADDIEGDFEVDGAAVFGQPVVLIGAGGFDTALTRLSGDYSFDGVDGFFILYFASYLASGESKVGGQLRIKGRPPVWPRLVFAICFNAAGTQSERVAADGEWGFETLASGFTGVALFGLAR